METLIPYARYSLEGLKAAQTLIETAQENVSRSMELGYQGKRIDFQAALDGDSGTALTPVAYVDATPIPQTYNPSHPKADAQGMVPAGSNVSIAQEMVSVTKALHYQQAVQNLLSTQIKLAYQMLQLGR